jgi:hypothetical protein
MQIKKRQKGISKYERYRKDEDLKEKLKRKRNDFG